MRTPRSIRLNRYSAVRSAPSAVYRRTPSNGRTLLVSVVIIVKRPIKSERFFSGAAFKRICTVQSATAHCGAFRTVIRTIKVTPRYANGKCGTKIIITGQKQRPIPAKISAKSGYFFRTTFAIIPTAASWPILKTPLQMESVISDILQYLTCPKYHMLQSSCQVI